MARKATIKRKKETKAAVANSKAEQDVAVGVAKAKIRSPSPEVIPSDEVQGLEWNRSNDPAVLDAPPIKMTLTERGLNNGFPSFYESSHIRQFAYPERTWKIEPWPHPWTRGNRPKDPYHDFSSASNDAPFHHSPFDDSGSVGNDELQPNPLHYPVGKMDQREVQEYVDNPKQWFRYDYLSFYTHWSSMCASHYEDKHDCFAFYTASGEMTSMFQWFDDPTDDSDINLSKIVASIWKRVHPPSYYLYRQKKIEASPDPKQHGYNTMSFRKMKVVFDGLPQTFSIMKKRVISIIAGNGVHFVCYMAINFGAHFKHGNLAEKEPSFIANLDSQGGTGEMDTFVQWLLAVIYELEVWVTKLLNTPALVMIDSPSLSEIGRKCKEMVGMGSHSVCQIPISHVPQVPRQTDTWNCGIFSLLHTRGAFLADLKHHLDWGKVLDTQSLWSLLLEKFWELGDIPGKPAYKQYRLNEGIQKFRTNFVALMLHQSSDLSDKKEKTSKIENANEDNKAPGFSRDCSSDSDLSLPIGDSNWNKVYPDMTSAGLFSYQLKDKTEQLAMRSKQRRLRRARWLLKSEGMTYKDRQAYFKLKHKKREARIWEATRPAREAKLDKKRKNESWREKSEQLEAIYRKPAKLLQREKKVVADILDAEFPITERTGELDDKEVAQISHLKYIPPEVRQLSNKEKLARRKAGLAMKGIEMHLSAFYQGLTYDEAKGKSYMVDKLNIMWVRDCFEEAFVTLVKNIGREETRSEVALNKRKWIPVPVGDSSSRAVSPHLVVNVRVRYEQGEGKTCLLRSLASAFHHLGQKHTGSVLASVAKKYANVPADEQLKAAINAVKEHDNVYNKVDYWKKEKALAKHDLIRDSNENPKLIVLRGCDGGVQHAVSVVGNIIFDSNKQKGLVISKQSLDWCCNCNGGFSRIHALVQFRK